MPTEKEIEITGVRQVADDFRALILQKQAAFDNDNKIDYIPDDLVKGTPYEAGVIIKDNTITYAASLNTYKWVYTPRVGDTPAMLTEIQGFN